jgi:membrane protein implicated in regulation of membrane protease activity
MELIFTIKFWLIVGLALSVLEVFSGLFFALSFGIAAFAIAGWLQIAPQSLTEWYEVIFIYSIFSLFIASLAWKKIKINQNKSVDIND